MLMIRTSALLTLLLLTPGLAARELWGFSTSTPSSSSVVTAAAGQTVLAEVDGTPIRLNSFLQESVSLEWTHLKKSLPPLTWRMRVLERLIENVAIVKAAERDGTLREPRIVKMRALSADQRLALAWFEREIFTRAVVSELAVKAPLPVAGDLAAFDLIRFPGPEQAASGRKLILAGKTFADLVAAGAAQRVGWGSTGLVNRGSGLFEKETEKALFALPKGGVSEPFIGHDGATYLAYVVDRAVEADDAQQKREDAHRETLLVRAREAARKRIRVELVAEDKIVIDYQAIQDTVTAGCERFEAACARTQIARDSAGGHSFAELIAYRDLLRSLGKIETEAASTPWISLASELLPEQAAARRARTAGLGADPALKLDLAAADEKLVFWFLREKVAAGVQVSAAEVADFYQKNKARYQKPERRQARQIVLADAEVARALAARVRGGEDFAALAREKSSDPTGKKGGDLGLLTRAAAEQISPSIANLIFSLSPGKVSDPFKTDGRYYLLLVDKIEPSAVATLEEMSETIRKALLDDKRNAAADIKIKAARKKAKVVLHEENMREIPF